MWILYTQLIIFFLFNETTGENFFCTDAFFQNEWLGQATSTTINQVRREQETGWQNLKQSNLPKNKWGVCPCHNAAFTDDSEQWDGVPSHGMAEIRSECYFSLPQCAQYFQDGNCAGAFPSPPTPTETPTKILIATITPYTINQLSNKQAGKCSSQCDFQHPVPGQPIDIDSYDGIVWPLDWSFGTSNTLPVPTNIHETIRNKQLWIGFTEEDMFKTIGGRPDLWSNQTFLQQFDLLSSYDYNSADLPFNLWKMHFFRSCTPNVYFAPPPNHFPTTKTTNLPLVSYVSRNCRQQRDDWVLELTQHLKVAAIGKCLHNYEWPFPKKSYPYWLEKVMAIRRFPFVLAIEGSDEPGKSGLVSEKLFDAFAAGTVPIYWGAPRHTVEKLAPSPKSFIHVDDFDGDVLKLSQHLIWLSKHPKEYMKYHAWRAVGPTPQFCTLLDTNINTLACRMCQSVTKHKTKHQMKMEKTKKEEIILSEINADSDVVGQVFNQQDIYVIVIKSKAENIVRRQTIRDTWGSLMHLKNGINGLNGVIENPPQILVHFLISNSIITSELQQEMDQNNDIIVTSRVEGEALLDYSLILINTIDSMNANRKLKHSNSNTNFLKYLIVIPDTIMMNTKKIIALLNEQVQRNKLYMGVVAEYELNGTPIKVESNRDGTDLLVYPVHADANQMYILSGDIVQWLSKNVQYLSNGKWMKSNTKLNVEGPILATWLVVIQAHAQRGCADCMTMQWSTLMSDDDQCPTKSSLSYLEVDVLMLNTWKEKKCL